MGIYINGLDFNSASVEDDPSLTADFRFIEKLGRAVPGLTTMYDRKDGAKNIIRLASQLDRRALAA